MDALLVFSAQPGMEDMEQERKRLAEILAGQNQMAKLPLASLCWDFTPIYTNTTTKAPLPCSREAP